LNENEIETCANFKGHLSISLLELRKNKLTICKGLDTMPCLVELYLAENEITSLEGLKDLDNLEKLHLRKNKIEKFDFVPSLPKLKYLNIRDNLIASKDELAKLHSLVTLQQLNMQGCPYAEEKGDDFKKEVLIYLDEIKWVKINKEEVTAEEVEEAAKEKKERIEAEIEADKERLR
jgi:protein phosphatase 1 regulatory subunit 7